MSVPSDQLVDASLAIPAEAERFYALIPYESRLEYLAKNMKHILFLSAVSLSLIVGIFTAHTLLLMTGLTASVISFFAYMYYEKLPSDAIEGLCFLLSSRKDNRADKVHEAYALDLKRTNDVLRWTDEIINDPMYHLRFTRSSEFYSTAGRDHREPFVNYDAAFVPDMHAVAVALAGLIQGYDPALSSSQPLSVFQDRASHWNPQRALYMVNQSMTLEAVLNDLQCKRAFITSYKNPDIPSQLANLVGLLASAYADLIGLNAQELGEALKRPVFEAIAGSPPRVISAKRC